MRMALGIEYKGCDYFGWQRQTHVPTVQALIEGALSRVADESIQLVCAGRTDAGVHATGQVVHFDTSADRKQCAWIMGTNTHLPTDVSVRWALPVDEQFHARFSALSRGYRYLIYNHLIPPAILSGLVTGYHRQLAAPAMQLAANYLLGEHDFTSFRSSQCQSKSPMRYVSSIKVERQHEFIIIDIEANAFLHHMVRNIVGVLMEVGCGDQKPEWVYHVLMSKDRRKAAKTAAASGLYLNYVCYPVNYSLPVGRTSFIIL